MLHLEIVTPNNGRLDLRVREDQRTFVSDIVHIVAGAYAYQDCHSRVYTIYGDEIPVDMDLYYDVDALGTPQPEPVFIDRTPSCSFRSFPIGENSGERLFSQSPANRFGKVLATLFDEADLSNTAEKVEAWDLILDKPC